MYTEPQVRELVKDAVSRTSKNGARPRDGDSLVFNLGFDSLRIATLAMELEKQLGRPLLLVNWVGRCGDPKNLTVGSLSDYVYEVVSRDGA